MQMPRALRLHYSGPCVVRYQARDSSNTSFRMLANCQRPFNRNLNQGTHCGCPRLAVQTGASNRPRLLHPCLDSHDARNGKIKRLCLFHQFLCFVIIRIQHLRNGTLYKTEPHVLQKRSTHAIDCGIRYGGRRCVREGGTVPVGTDLYRAGFRQNQDMGSKHCHERDSKHITQTPNSLK